jgi:hypothetical protein
MRRGLPFVFENYSPRNLLHQVRKASFQRESRLHPHHLPHDAYNLSLSIWRPLRLSIWRFFFGRVHTECLRYTA